MPLELKTGHASFSSEHKGQLIIYQMMMSETGYNVTSGLLLYLRYICYTMLKYCGLIFA